MRSNSYLQDESYHQCFILVPTFTEVWPEQYYYHHYSFIIISLNLMVRFKNMLPQVLSNIHTFFQLNLVSKNAENSSHYFILILLSFCVICKEHRVDFTYMESEILCLLIAWSVLCYLVTCSLIFTVLYVGYSLKVSWGR